MRSGSMRSLRTGRENTNIVSTYGVLVLLCATEKQWMGAYRIVNVQIGRQRVAAIVRDAGRAIIRLKRTSRHDDGAVVFSFVGFAVSIGASILPIDR